MNYNACTQIRNCKTIVLKENKSKFICDNKKAKSIRQIEVDGCLIANNEEKCDWLLAIDEPEKLALYIELKGSDVAKAFSQLKATMIKTQNHFKSYTKQCYIVTTRIPKSGADITRLRKDFHRATKATVKVKNGQLTVSV